MKKIALAVFAVIPFAVPALAQTTRPSQTAGVDSTTLVQTAQVGPIEVLLQNTGYSSAELNATLEQAWNLYQHGYTDINATAKGGNTILHLIVRATPDQWPTKLEQWVKAGVRDVPNDDGKTALQTLKETMRKISEENKHASVLQRRSMMAEYVAAHKVLSNTPEEKQRREIRRRARQELYLQTLDGIARTDK